MALYCQSPWRAAYHMYRGSLPNAAPMVLSVGGAPLISATPVPPSTLYIHSLAAPPSGPSVFEATTYLPSGVNTGDTYRLSFPFVSWSVSFLSRDMIQRLSPPLRSD